jgi:excisionase family DNA binding protein
MANLDKPGKRSSSPPTPAPPPPPPAPAPNKIGLTLDEAGELVGVCGKTLRKWKGLKTFRVGRVVRVRPEDLDAYIAEHARPQDDGQRTNQQEG